MMPILWTPILVATLVSGPSSFAPETPKIALLNKGDETPFDGVLLNTQAIRALQESIEVAENATKTCDAKVGQVEREYDTIVKEMSKENMDLRAKWVQASLADEQSFWYGVGAGVLGATLTTLAVVYATSQ